MMTEDAEEPSPDNRVDNDGKRQHDAEFYEDDKVRMSPIERMFPSL